MTTKTDYDLAIEWQGGHVEGQCYCDDCLREKARSIIDGGLCEGLESFLRYRFYTLDQGLIALGRISLDDSRLEKFLDNATNWWLRD